MLIILFLIWLKAGVELLKLAFDGDLVICLD